MKQDLIVVLDLGSTRNTVVARAIRELGVYSEIHPHDITVDELKALKNVKGIVLNGGENRVVDGQAVEIRPELYHHDGNSLMIFRIRKHLKILFSRSVRRKLTGI